MGFILILLIFAGICLGIGVLCSSSQKNTLDKNKEEYINAMREVCEKNDIHFVTPQAVYVNGEFPRYEYGTQLGDVKFGDNLSQHMGYACYWRDGDNIVIVNRTEALKIPVNSITHFGEVGDIKKYSQIENIGKAVSLEGAIVGGFIGGAAGMVVGATKDRINLQNTIKSVDERSNYICYKIADKEMLLTVTPFHQHFENYLKLAANDKYINNLVTEVKQNINNSAKNTDTNDTSLEKELEELKKLFTKGLITEEEYALKKKSLLNI